MGLRCRCGVARSIRLTMGTENTCLPQSRVKLKMIKTYIFYLIQFYVILATPHINLHHSDWTNENEMYTTLLHDCLYLSAATELMGESYQTMSYCLTEWPSKWNIFENNNEKRFTFAELYQQNITSEQLYLWSASMKLIEDYETYRNQRSLNPNLQFIRYKNIRSSQHGLYSTVSEHIQLLKKLIFIETPNSVSDDCWLVFKCYFNITKEFDPKCENHHFNQTFIDMINITCPEQFLIPATPIAFSHIYFLYFKELIMNSDQMFTPHYICYNHQYCHNFLSNRTLISFNNLTCRKPQDFPILFNSENNKSDIEYYIKEIYKQLYQCNTVFLTICNNTKMYQCFNSLKCIFADQLCDGIKDCDYHDDEYCPLINDTCVKGHFKCRLTEKCISIDLIYNDDCDCSSDDIISCEDRMKIYDQRKDFIPFSSICDSYTQLNPVLIDNRYETDETDCDHWQCNNTYTRCDSKWNCWNGADEINCNSMLKCPFNSHQCVSPKTYKLICLPLEQAGDGRIDCVGATDEPKLCRSTQLLSTGNFYCINNMNHTCIDSSRLCSENNRCMNEEDEQLCSSFRNLTKSNDICSYEYSLNRTEAHTFFCDRFWNEFTNTMAYFKLNHMEFPKKKSIKQIEVTKSKERFPLCWSYSKEEQRCYRGLPIHVWLDSEKNRSSKACLCPPSYYGEACQYDRQRISLTLKFQVHSDSRRTLFTFVVILIDNDNDQRIIYSYEQYTYFYQRDCSMKYNIYLLHPISSFLFSKNYSIHIDVYEKIGLTYRGSFFIPIKFSFLPVNRIATQLIIPRRNHTTKTCSNQSCHHGQCINYINDRQGSTFCQCYDGWYGKSCTIRYTSQCSSHSLSIGVAVNNQSVCVCPINRWGSRCLLWSNTCQQSDENSICKNGGQCIPDNKQFILSQSYICVCRRGFSGTNCEDVVPFINLTFHKEIHLPQSIIIHFIHDVDQNTHLVTQSSDVQRITFYQKEIIIYWTTRFNIAIAQLLKNYYLILVQNRNMWNIKKYNQTILPSYRCKHVSEVLNETILSYHQFRRVKYYQIPCEKYAPDLNCFYDDDYFCLCYDFNHQRLSNCFNFNSKTSQTCYGLSDCENNGECIQNDPKCPKESICVCPKCFHGTLCQFSSHSFGLSLDAILGYYIQPNVSLIDQLFIIKMSLTLTIIISILATSKRRRKTQCRLTYQQILQEQFREHKNLLIAPIVLVLLTLPRLIFSFMSDCMNSTRNIWLPLSGYFISFIPPLLTFVIFVLPSRLYMKEFKKSLKQIRLSFRS
ncbi:hypothetical protein I4U23_016737 [Adineta vaga]|nr:hypothetical protein I4U23_016737 [Adineta vaga]